MWPLLWYLLFQCDNDVSRFRLRAKNKEIGKFIEIVTSWGKRNFDRNISLEISAQRWRQRTCCIVLNLSLNWISFFILDLAIFFLLQLHVQCSVACQVFHFEWKDLPLILCKTFSGKTLCQQLLPHEIKLPPHRKNLLPLRVQEGSTILQPLPHM